MPNSESEKIKFHRISLAQAVIKALVNYLNHRHSAERSSFFYNFRRAKAGMRFFEDIERAKRDLEKDPPTNTS